MQGGEEFSLYRFSQFWLKILLKSTCKTNVFLICLILVLCLEMHLLLQVTEFALIC